MPRTKIVLIGAGSTEFTPGLLADLVGSPSLRDSEVALVDIDPWAVDTMVGLARRLATERGADLVVSGTTDRREALPGADFVTTTIAVGGARGWETDVRVPEKYGVYQTVGDSVGPGGVFRALRHVPEIVAHRPRHGRALPGCLALQLHQPAVARSCAGCRRRPRSGASASATACCTPAK